MEPLKDNPFSLAPIKDEKLSFIGTEEDLAQNPDILQYVSQKEIMFVDHVLKFNDFNWK